MGLLARLFGRAKSVAEGQYRPGPYYLSDGWLPAGTALNFWQMGQNVRAYPTCSAMVEACVSAYAQTVAMCPGDHWRQTGDGGRERVTNSALVRILRAPNSYQSISDFLLNITRSLYLNGNAYALALRNDRFEIAELHMMNARSCFAQVGENGEVFYSLGGNEIIDRRLGGQLTVPARDVLHVRLHTPRHPLRGETPLEAAASAIAASDAMMHQQIAFYLNQARPSNVLTTDAPLTAEQIKMLREKWNEQSQGLNAGGTPILAHGLKPMRLTSAADEAQLAEIMKLSDQQIAVAFRIPLQIIGIGGTPFASTELLMQSWIAQGLGFALNHIEEAFGQLFGLKGQPDEYLELNTKALLRSSFKERLEGLARAVQGGIYSPDEARAEEELPRVPGGFGEEPRVQQQVVPLSAAAAIPAAPPAPPSPGPDDKPEPEKVANDNERIRRSFRAAHSRHVAV